MPTHTFGSLFAGVGGFDLGFEAAGWQCKFQVEWDKHCQQILARHWPDVPRWSDVSDVDGKELPPVDCITFGSPCQDLSVAGRRAGLDGNRSNLFFEATRIIKEMRHATGNQYPRIAVWENVPGALSSNKGADFSAVLDNLADSGALAIEWAVLDAQHFGIPQRRRRIFLVAVFDPAIARNCGTQILSVTEGSRRNSKKSNTKGEGVARTLGESPKVGSELGTIESPTKESTAYSIREDAKANNFSATETDVSLALNALRPSTQSHHAQLFITQTTPQPFVKVIRSGARDANGDLPAEVWREEQTAPTLNSMDNTGESRATVIFTAQRVGEPPRIYENTTPSLLSRMGTGGNNVPMIAEAIPIQDGREIEKRQNGLGVGKEGDPAYTLDTTGAQAVGCVYSFDTQFGSNANVFEDQSLTLKASQQSPSISTLAPTLTAANNPSRSPQSTEITNQVAAVFEAQYAVRRLTPIECERLMGWSDDHTRWKADGTEQADSHRYKQCGNGVAAPVAQWVAKQLNRIMT